MLRRQFIAQTGLLAAVAVPTASVAAHAGLEMLSASNEWTLLSASGGGQCGPSHACQQGTVQILVEPQYSVAGLNATARLWFQTDHGQAAIELASFAVNGNSQRFRFVADAERLFALEGETSAEDPKAQCLLAENGLGHLGVGQHWLVLHAKGASPTHPEADSVLARVRLQVQTV
ncbi:hypothetical protein C7S18_22845 [Ahniella affigens]|uniref:Uncharacterized protein n=1 Tax=Ahniella affigens TaxID=2021234 RepID=A0A2P1PYB8_9GAMM|nr:hypothetical protein [Ahniella affigens]AVP99838.1 hypothetical protein C7S18_22845 [Ahniella affigens]